ncbi:BMP family ABC transporter substrate-binding protein [Streptococcus sobrinus]|nr:BMP family ABC transporter substrate-binding protein [Streptococcus sobrinus]OZV23764.1 BMP family ABC transporter substrate-binding protein [Streptococcus sobrinus]
MKMNKKLIGLGLAVVAILSLGACSRSSQSSSSKVKAAIVTDTGGVDDKSFNQSAWEGMKAWGKENKLKEKTDYTYFQSKSESDYATNLDAAQNKGFNLVFGIGYNLHDAISDAAKANTKTNYVLIDSEVTGQKNVASVLFADNEGAYLAGIAAAMQTKTNHVGFVGGVKSDTITRFETGFKAGVASVNKGIKVDVQYVGSYNDATNGKGIADSMYSSGADVIYHAAGASGTGVFTAAKDIDQKLSADSKDKVWVIGVDRDQTDEGNYKATDKESNFVLTSTIKEVGTVVKDIANDQLDGKKFQAKTTTYGLKDKGVDIVTNNLPEKTKKAVESAKKDIIDGKTTVKDGVKNK